jgi:hypothetical protein
MSRVGFQKSVRMFHKFSEETMRRRGADEAGRESVAALAAIEAVLKAERLFDASLLEPLAAFTNLLQSSQLPPDFGDYSFADALLAIEEAHAELRQSAQQIWEFAPELTEEAAAALGAFATPIAAAASAPEHAAKLRRCVLDAAQQVEPGTLLVVGALASPDLPLAELAARFERLTLSDLELPRLEELVRRAIPEQHRSRVKLERYDATGSYAQFAQGVQDAVGNASGPASAESALLALVESYDVSAGSAGLSVAEEKPNLAISAMLLSELGRGYSRCISAALTARGWDAQAPERAPLGQSLLFLRSLVAQHHVQALLRRAKSAVLISAVSEVEWRGGPGNKGEAAGEPSDLLSVERLVERLPEIAEVKAEQSWEWRQDQAPAAEKRSLLTLVEAVLV